MPNHIKNKLELIGSIEDIDQLIKRFSTYVPASLKLTHDEKLVICKPKDNSFDYRWLDLKTGELHGRKEIIGFGLGDTHEPEIQDSILIFPDFEKVIPPPDDPAYKDQPTQKEAEKSPNWWYRWNIDHWGTKWSAYECQRPAINVFTFETAWSSVPVIVEAISKAFPKVTIKYSWADEDTGYNCGRAIYRNGLLEEEKPEGGSIEAYDIAFELRPGYKDNYTLVDGKYQYTETD